MNRIELSVPGMTCGHCVAAVEGEVAKLVGVDEVTVDLESKAVVVTGSALDRDAIAAAVDEAGYDAVFA